jgi:hypothetical protein
MIGLPAAAVALYWPTPVSSIRSVAIVRFAR